MVESSPSLRHSLLIRIAGAMTFVTLVVLIGMGSAAIVVETARGNAVAINEAGSLRMQSQRMASLVLAIGAHPANPEYRRELSGAIAAFEQSLDGPVLAAPSLVSVERESGVARRALVVRWRAEMKPLLLALARNQAPLTAARVDTLLDQTAGFISDINTFVSVIEKDTESRIGSLHSIIVLTLVVTLGVVLMVMGFLNRSVLKPLRSLGAFTAEIRRGNLEARTPNVSEDELGRLGQAFNLMAEDLAALYRSLESRVAEKTADLERSNRSLELLYRSIARLYGGSIEPDTYVQLLREIEEVMGLGPGSACLSETGEQKGVTLLASTLQPAAGAAAFCSVTSCAECFAGDVPRVRELDGRQILSMPLRDAEQVYGVMQLVVPDGYAVEPWKMQLLEALSHHIGTAIASARRAEHDRVLSLLEERSVIARELHDSLAQSLSYMKIQVSRLGVAIQQDKASAPAMEILRELREGLNSAYRQLRELLTTFRLRVEGDSLAAVLEETVREFAERGGLRIDLEADLTNFHLSPNEEIHVLQIVREALSNVLHHARARHARVALRGGANDMVTIAIEDDGVGIGAKVASAHHYGMTIMEERARGLGGQLAVRDLGNGGTRVEIEFVPTCRKKAKTRSQETIQT